VAGGDYDGASDIDVLSDGIGRGTDELLALAEPPRAGARRARMRRLPTAKE
jgi:hypothetical protein